MPFKTSRCQCRNKTNNKICAIKVTNSYPVKIERNNISLRLHYCWFHYKYYMEKHALTIQRFYRGSKNRKFMKNVYCELPDDLQRKIVFHIRQYHYYQKYKNTIIKIVKNKLYDFTTNIDFQYTNYTLLNYVYVSNDYLTEKCKLYKKYSEIFKDPYKEYLNLRFHLIKIRWALEEFEENIHNAGANHIYNVVYATYIRLINIIDIKTHISNIAGITRLTSLS